MERYFGLFMALILIGHMYFDRMRHQNLASEVRILKAALVEHKHDRSTP